MGLTTELGPFRTVFTGNHSSLVENVWGWTKMGNVLFLESPYGVGYSYTTNASYSSWNDSTTAEINVGALKEFFGRFPEYQNRPFYVTGESYGGVYVPTLVDQLLRTITVSAGWFLKTMPIFEI